MKPANFDISIVLPTFNEEKNVAPLLTEITAALVDTNYSYECIFVDDSTDNTASVIASLQPQYPNVRLVKRVGEEAKSGLTQAFLRGFQEATGTYVVCMDTDLQHPPAVIAQLIEALDDSHLDVVIASRYVKGGDCDGLSDSYRRFVSKAASWFVWLLLPATRQTTDPMTGFFAFKREVLEHITFSSSGFKILVELLVAMGKPRALDIPFTFRKRLHEESKATVDQGVRFLKDTLSFFIHSDKGNSFIKYLIAGFGSLLLYISTLSILENAGALVANIPEKLSIWIVLVVTTALMAIFAEGWVFTKKNNAESSWSLRLLRGNIWTLATSWFVFLFLDIFRYQTLIADLGFVKLIGAAAIAWLLGYILLRPILRSPKAITESPLRWIGLLLLYIVVVTVPDFLFLDQVGTTLLLALYALVITQGIFAIYLMVYAWDSSDGVSEYKLSEKYFFPRKSFTVIVPCRWEKNTIRDTLHAMNRIEYPDHLKEVIVVIHVETDDGTIGVVNETIQEIGKPNFKLVTFTGQPVNKPRGLNYALRESTKDYVVIFDAEDEPHPELFLAINTVALKSGYDVIQSGVQLITYMRSWYSLFNVLEYYFWFKSSLHFFAKNGVVPLGGVTVFFRRSWLNRVGGWDQTCLTEDAEIGIRLSQAGAKIGVVYDAKYATQEETPSDLITFIKQRTRWAQGFLQILSRGTWKRLPTIRQKLLALYVISWPITLLGLFLLFPLGIVLMFVGNVPPTLAVMSNVPLVMFLLFVLVQLIGLYEFCSDYKLRFPWERIPIVILTFYPYTVLLVIAGVRGMYRNFKQNTSWEKTEHLNTHRNENATKSPDSTPGESEPKMEPQVARQTS